MFSRSPSLVAILDSMDRLATLHMSRSVPVFVEPFESQSFVQVLRPSPTSDHVIVGARQFVRAVTINEAVSGLVTLRSMKAATATTAVAFHPQADSVLVSAGSNGEVSVWYYGAQNIAPLNDRWTAHSRAVHGLDFIPQPAATSASLDRNCLVTVSADGEMNVWDICSYLGKRELWRKPTLVGNFRAPGLRSSVRDLDVARLGKERFQVALGCEDGSVELYESATADPRSLRLKNKLSVSTQTVNSVRISPDGSKLATGGKDSYIRLIDLGTFSLACSIRSPSPVWAVRWRPGGEYIAACQSVMDSGIYVWDLASRLMPAYVFNSHKDNVTDFFWVDKFHLVSCSRDNSVQMHAIKAAIIPIERMRTVNIAFSLKQGGGQTLTSVCDVVNREKFEKLHDPVNVDDLKNGCPALRLVGRDKAATLTPSCANTRLDRTLVVSKVGVKEGFSLGPESLTAVARALTGFVTGIALATDSKSAGNACMQFSAQLVECGGASTGSQAEAMRLLGWLLLQPPTSTNKSVVPIFLSTSLQTYQQMNDVAMVLALGAVCVYASDALLAALISSSQYVSFTRAYLALLRRMGLWQQAAEHVFHSPLAEVRAISHARTGINICCINCNREQEGVSKLCQKCSSSLTDCSLCGNEVKGLWTACEGCGHGGHVKHMESWFERYDVCPVPDCLHQCR